LAIEAAVVNSKKILVFGGGNTEKLLITAGPIKIGEKNIVNSANSFGGSGVNCAARLLSMNAPAIPLLSIGDDAAGLEIRAFLEKAGTAANIGDGILAYFRSPDFFTSGLGTAESFILVHAGTRTIFKSKGSDDRAFYSSLASRINKIESNFGTEYAAVLIGHLPSPREGLDRESDPTTLIVERFYGRCPIFINFGQEQLSRGYGYWEELLKKVDYVQLHINEARGFFSESIESAKLPVLMEFLSTLEAIFCITLDDFGAICLDRQSRDGSHFIFAPEYISDESLVVDPTGAGDAFIAGTIFHLWQAGQLDRSGNYKWNNNELGAALEEGRKWAAFACTKLGGASEPPDSAALRQFVNQLQFDKTQPLMLYDRAASEQFLRIIDKACQQSAFYGQ